MRQSGKGQRVEVGKKTERRGVGYSESISAHTTITTTEDSGHDVYNKCMRNESTVSFMFQLSSGVLAGCRMCAPRHLLKAYIEVL